MAALAASGCARPCLFDETGMVTVEAAADANRRSATAVDVAAAGTAEVADRLAGLDAGAYFAARAQLQRDFPASFVAKGWEIAPGQSIGPEEVRFPCGPAGVFVFASLRAPGAHRVRVDVLDELRIAVGPDSVEVAP